MGIGRGSILNCAKIPALGRGISTPEGALPTWTPQYKEILKAVTGAQPSNTVKTAHNNFIKYLLGDNSDSRDVWSKLSCIIPYGAGMPSATDALIWWNNPERKATLSATAPTYTAKQGFAGNGSSSYIDTDFNPSVDGGALYTQNDCSNGWYFYNNRTTGADKGNGLLNTATNEGIALNPKYNTTLYYRCQGAFGNRASETTNRLFIATRANATQSQIYIDKVGSGVDTAASVALQNDTVLDLAQKHAGAEIFNYTDDTIGLRFFGASFDQTDINIICDAWDQLIMEIQTMSSSLVYTGDEATIDLTKWTITDAGTGHVSFEQNNGLIINSLPNAYKTDWFLNQIVSVASLNWGVVKFSLLKVFQGTSDVSIGLKDSTNGNRIEIYTLAPDVDLQLGITQSTSSVYDVADVIQDLAQVKIVITPFKRIKVYLWVNDAWNQIGATQMFRLGALSLYMTAKGGLPGYISLRDIYITNKDFTTLNPVL